jgi:hypothetical protein
MVRLSMSSCFKSIARDISLALTSRERTRERTVIPHRPMVRGRHLQRRHDLPSEDDMRIFPSGGFRRRLVRSSSRTPKPSTSAINPTPVAPAE